MSDGATQSGRSLWERYAAGSTGSSHPAEPDAATLAAWLDGRLPEAEAGPVEAWIAARPEAVAFVASLRADREGESVTEPPAALVARAQGLVRADPQTAGRARPSWLERLFSPALGAAFAAMLVAAVGGFELGSETFTDIERIDATIAAEIWLADEASDAFPEG